jgi:hypothetical protein
MKVCSEFLLAPRTIFEEATDLVTGNDLDPSRPGTRFKLFPQPPFGSPIEAETVSVSSPVGSIGPGPSDDRMFVIEPAAEKPPYGINYGPRGVPHAYLPPWDGPAEPPVLPDEEGHFDYLEPGMPEFEAAHVFGCARFVLDVWERYFGRRVPWHFEPDLDRLEIALLPRYPNAQAGFGFLELGSYFLEHDEQVPFTLNFDIIAHEIGHLIIASEVGLPTVDTAQGEYFGFHEAAADLVALVAAAHFDSVIDPLLEQTAGNLYVLNRLNRIGELSDNQEIRTASNALHLSTFADGWVDEHDLSLPLTGAIFDILVDIFHELLVERRLISPEMEHLADVVERQPEHEGLIQSLFDATFSRNPGGFKEALVDARDWIGSYLAQALIRLSPHHLNYDDVAAVLLEVDDDMSERRYQRLIARNFDLRGIGSVRVGPRLKPPGAKSHAFSARTLVPASAVRLPRLSYRERWALVQK